MLIYGIYIYIDFKNQNFQEWHKIAPLNIRASKARTITLAVLKKKKYHTKHNL